VRAEVTPDALWPRVSAVIALRMGLHFPEERRNDLERGLADAAVELGFGDARSCARWLLSSEPTKPQLDTIASHLTVGETYFLRDPRALEALATQILPALIERRRGREQRLRLWSAACSTGEEAYSLAILLRQVLPDWQNWSISVLGTDINPHSIRKAMRGVYGEWSFRDTPAGFRERYFERTEDGQYSVRSAIRSCVSFSQINLAQDGFPSLATDTNAMDVVLCRNVLIYFEPAQSAALIRKLRRALVDDGWLLVSPSEYSQTLYSGFVATGFPGAVLYRKAREPIGRAEPQTLTHATVPGYAAVPSSAAAPSSPAAPSYTGPPGAAVSESAAPRALISQSISATGPRPILKPEDFSRLTRARANEGRLDEALAWSERWIVADKLDAAAHYINAMVLQELGDREQARRSLQRAIYLKPDFALAHFALGHLTEDSRSRVNRHFENALELLRQMPAEEIVPESDGLTAGRLSEIIATLLPAREART
jgi:chemotaxis protein methyltransferase CheR